MTRDSILIVGDCYRNAVKKSLDIQEVADLFAKNLRDSGSKDLQLYACQMQLCSEARKHTFLTTNLVSDMLTLATYVVLFRIRTDPTFNCASVKFSGRRKAYESEAKKSLEHLIDNDSPEIQDRFGCRINVLNEGLEAIRMADIITNDLIEIFCGYNPQRREEFINWINSSTNSPEFDRKTKAQLLETLSYTFMLAKSGILRGTGNFVQNEHPKVIVPKDTFILPEYQFGVKNYILTPKDNGYQSNHFVLQMPPYSEICPGCYVEFQIRTNQMDNYAELDLASHSMYKASQQAKFDEYGINEAFQLDPNEIGLLGFTLLENGTWSDKIGLRNAMHFKSRHVTHHTIF